MIPLKFHHYEDVQRKYTLCKGIDDIYPYELLLPEPPKEEKIINFGLSVEEQMFKRTVLPKEIKALNFIDRQQAINAVDNNPNLADYIEKMWYKMLYGEWQYINGKPLHFSPTYWFYLNFWEMDIGLPSFRWDDEHYCTDLWNFAWWDYIVTPSDMCYGEISGARRRDGKTFRAACKAYRRVIMRRNSQGAIQSKDESAAISLFTKKMVDASLKLPFFFKPSSSSGSYPGAEGFKFKPKSERGKTETNEIIIPDNYLMSIIKPLNAKETAVAGEKWHVHISDEDGNLDSEINSWERHNVLKPCLTQEETIIGKEISTTTVEDMNKAGGITWKYKWNKSNRDPRVPMEKRTVNAFGETESGLFPWFTPSYANIVWNQFNKSIMGDPTAQEQKWLKEVKGDKFYMKGGRQRIDDRINSKKSDLDKMKEMRLYARTVKEMFTSVTGFCHFNAAIIIKRLEKYALTDFPEDMAGKMTYGNFVWSSVFGGDVEFIACSPDEARWYLSYIPAPNMRNRYVLHPENGKKAPANTKKFSSGADPFKFDTDEVVHKDKMSDGTMTIWAETDPEVDTIDKDPEDHVTGDICGEYSNRPDTVNELCEDYLKACIFYGMKVMPEKNNEDVIKAFKRWNYENYIQRDMGLKKLDSVTFLAEKGYGTNTNTDTIQSYFKNVQWYVKEKGMRCKFPRTLRQLLEVTPDNLSPYDLFVSLSMCLRVVQDFNPIRYSHEEVAEDIGDLAGFLSPSTPRPSEWGGGESVGMDM